MKRALTLVVLIITPTLAFAQGTVVFQNLTGLVKQWGCCGEPPLVTVTKGNAMVDLITAAHGTALPHPLGTLSSGGWGGVFVPAYGTLASFLAANPGWHSEAVGGVNAANGIFNDGSVSLTGIPGGALADYFLIGWTEPYPTLDAAIAGGYGDAAAGESGIFTTLTGDPTTTPPGVPISLKATFTGMALALIVPEPSIFALFALGIVVLVPLCRLIAKDRS